MDEERQRYLEQNQKIEQSVDDKKGLYQVNINLSAQAQAQTNTSENAGKNGDDYEIVLKYMENINFQEFLKLLRRVKLKTLWKIIGSALACMGFVFSIGYGSRFGVNKVMESKSDSVRIATPMTHIVPEIDSDSEEKNKEQQEVLELEITHNKATQIWDGKVLIKKYCLESNALVFIGIIGWTKNPTTKYLSWSSSECPVEIGDKVYIKRMDGEIWCTNVLETGVSSIKISMFPYKGHDHITEN